MEQRIQAIISHLESSGESQSKLAQRAGLSTTVINQIIKGKYVGNYETTLPKIEEAIRDYNDKQAVIFKAPNFIKTSVSRKIYNALSQARSVSIPRMLVLYGASGIGKTRTIEEYVEQNTTTTLIEVSPDFTFGSLLQEIAQEIGVHSHGKHYEIRKRIVSKLKDSNRMLIIDEAEYLTPKSLDILRRIHDKAKIPVVLIGMPNLYHNIKSLRKGFEQIANRMVSYNLGVPTDEDMLQIVNSCLSNTEKRTAEALIKVSKSTIRTLILLMQNLVLWSTNKNQQFTATEVHKLVNSLH